MFTSQSILKTLNADKSDLSETSMRDLFASDPDRAKQFSIEAKDLYFDYSKNIIDQKTLADLIALAMDCGLKERISAMFNGDRINQSENRAVLHTALRDQSDRTIMVDGKDVMADVRATLNKIKAFSEKIQKDDTITDVVNIGIGGSDLGPKMVIKALTPYLKPGLNVHFVSNVDGTDICETLKKLQPEHTLFIISSKTFTTDETLTNAKSAKKWLVDDLGQDAVATHFVAVSANAKAVADFGLDADNNMFEFWDWVGGRYSLWSAIGLPIAIAAGYDNFIELLQGAYAMDEHFKSAPFDKNIPVIMGLCGVWYYNFWGAKATAVLPYDEYLSLLPSYLQQLQMESNGKSVDKNGNPTDYQTGVVVFGASGTNGQHSFYQLLHQGTELIPCDFIAPAISHNELDDHHEKLLANFLAQSEALMNGKTADELRKEGVPENLINQKRFVGNRPSNTILFDKMTPFNLGMLIAMYEHKTFVEGVIWNINSFDQFGVELGKQMANKILPELKDENQKSTAHDSSTAALINRIRNIRSSIR